MEKLTSLFLFIASAIIFRIWFTAREVIGGDWPYFFSSFLNEFTLFPPSWASYQGNGLGGEFISYSLDSYLYLLVYLFVNGLHVPWEIVYKVFFFGFYIVSSILSSIYLLTTVLPTAKIWHKVFTAFVFTTNIYILMVVGGGQMGIALAYSVAPFALGTFIKLVNSFDFLHRDFKSQISNLKLPIIVGLVLAVQVMFDLRIAFITVGISLFYAVYHYFFIERFNLKLYVGSLSLIGFIVFGLHVSWVLPIIIFRVHPAAEIVNSFSSVESFRFFSFATFSQTLSLLHPNWPENIFGKIGFMKPEFLILPILAYSSLLFLNKSKVKSQKSKVQAKNNKFYSSSEAASDAAESRSSHLSSSRQARTILFFALLGLIGAFLAKGANPPFGEINMWMFTHIPGFAFFRDPTKFYLLTALSYSALIPFSTYSIYRWLSAKCKVQSAKLQFKVKSYIPYLFLLFTILYLIFLIRPAISGQLNGTFKKHEIPQEYIKFKDFIYNQHQFFRTLWIPRQQRFTYYSNVNPSVEALPLLNATNLAEVVEKLKAKDTAEFLSELSIKYVIIPYDEFGEIFVKDRKYDEKQYQYTIEELKTVPWLKRINGFGKIAVFEIPNPKDHFWIKEGDLVYKMLSPDRYSLKISTPISTSLLFSEAYSPHWAMKIENEFVATEKTKSGINSFKIIKAGNYDVEVYFVKEIYYRVGWVFSALTLFLLGIFFVFRKKFSI